MRVLAFVALSACGFSNSAVTGGDDQMPPEAGMGSEPATTECESMPWSFTPAEFDPCMLPAPAAPPTFSNGMYVIDSGSGLMKGPMGAMFQAPYVSLNGVGIVSLTSLTVPMQTVIRAEGTLPLVIASWSSVSIAGEVHANSTTMGASPGVPGLVGAGANPVTCGASIGGNGDSDNGGDGGGGGGAFQANGGVGGNGNNIANSGGVRGMLRARPAIIEGGCRGGNATTGDGGTPGSGGAGGGAVALIARESLSIAGLVHVGGAGGTGGSTSRNGGGGGGSGGMIKLEASTITFAASTILAANGGAGGGGCQGSTAGAGANGTPGATEPTIANSEGNGTDGGGGGWRDRATGNSASTAGDGGGGGGGGVGYIVYKGHTNVSGIGNATSSPAAVSF